MWQGCIFGCFDQAVKHGEVMFDLIQTHFYTNQDGLFAEVLWWLVHLHSLSLNSNMAGEHFWLLQPVFSHNKSC